MKEEIIVFYCETTGQGIAHAEHLDNTPDNLIEAERKFKMWSNCYMVKIRTVDEDNMFSDRVIFKRNIEV